MKKILQYCIMALMLDIGYSILPTETHAQVSFQVFYDRLSPYGHWVYFPDRGYVWMPNDEAGFYPYETNGYWVYTDYGWTWVSDYPWGWAPFHYGRWDFDDDYGWYWEPGDEWAPAWVAWASYPGYCGWAPLRPGIEVDAVITSGYYARPDHWCYVSEGYLGRHDIGRYYEPRTNNATYIRNSRMVNNTFVDRSTNTKYIAGPRASEVQQASGAPVRQIPLAMRSTPGQSVSRNQVSIFRPVVARTTSTDPKPAPTRVASLQNLRPLPGRAQNVQQRITTQPPQMQQNRTPANTSPAMRQNPAIGNPRAVQRQSAPQNNQNINNRTMMRQNRNVNTSPSQPQRMRQQNIQRQSSPRNVSSPQRMSSPPPQRTFSPRYTSPPPQRTFSPPPQRFTAPPQRTMPQSMPRQAPPMRSAPPQRAPAPQPHGGGGHPHNGKA